MSSRINTLLLKVPHHADRVEPQVLFQTFVDTGPPRTQLSSFEHQVIYGRRGTGKTHALIYLQESVRRQGDFALYVDMRTLGSSGGIYADPRIPLTQRGTRLIVDVLARLQEELTTYVLDAPDDSIDASILDLLGRLADEVATVRVVGSVETERTATESANQTSTRGFGFKLGTAGPAIGGAQRRSATSHHLVENRLREAGTPEHRVHFGALHAILQKMLTILPVRIWLLLDEWSDIPVDLQPLLADLLKRCFLPLRKLTIKIAAIEHRSCFRVLTSDGGSLGLEVGADVSAAIDLDDFLVFGHDPDKAKDFFAKFLFAHIRAGAETEGMSTAAYTTPERVLDLTFESPNVFAEYVKAVEGVPRDALEIAGIAAQMADEVQIGLEMVRKGAERWYQRDKEPGVSTNPYARDLLHWIITQVVRDRLSRAFLVRQDDTSYPLLEYLYDSRVVHLIRKGMHSPARPGVRFDVYGLDYGCYIDLRLTGARPQGVLAAEDEAGDVVYLDVPPDDPMEARRSILDLADFTEATLGGDD